MFPERYDSRKQEQMEELIRIYGGKNMKWLFIDTKIAKELLGKNDGNRPLPKTAMTRFCYDMMSGKWNPFAPSPIVLGKNNNLIDGQTRLHAIIQTSSCIPCLVIHCDLFETAKDFIGSGAGENRKLEHFCEFTKSHIRMASAIATMLRHVYGSSPPVTVKQLLASSFAKEAAVMQMAKISNAPGVNIAAVKIGFLLSMYENQADAESISEQFSKLTRADPGRWNSILWLQRMLMGIGTDAAIRESITVSSWWCSSPSNKHRKTMREEDRPTIKQFVDKVFFMCKERGFPLPEPNKKFTHTSNG